MKKVMNELERSITRDEGVGRRMVEVVVLACLGLGKGLLSRGGEINSDKGPIKVLWLLGGVGD